MGIQKKSKKRLVIVFIFISLLIFFYPLRSYIIMGIYSNIQKRDSIFLKYDIDIQIKGGVDTLNEDYYPFLMYFNDSLGFSRYSGIDCEMSIVYNFGQFEFPFISSSILNEKSKYFATFYGAYAVKPQNREYAFGYRDGKMNMDEIVLVPKYDLTQLVLNDLGCENISFQYTIENTTKNSNGFDIVDAILITNSLAHKYEGFKWNYLQYGRPYFLIEPEQPFIETTYYGRIYSKYIKEKNITMFYYIISADKETLEECDVKFMSEIKY